MICDVRIEKNGIYHEDHEGHEEYNSEGLLDWVGFAEVAEQAMPESRTQPRNRRDSLKNSFSNLHDLHVLHGENK